MATWTFVKRAGAPAGQLNINIGNSSYPINDTTTPTIVTSLLAQAADLQNHPFLTLQGITGASTVPVPLLPVALQGGLLTKFDGSGNPTVFDGSEFPGGITGAGTPSVTGTPATNLASTFNVAMSATTPKWVTGVLANATTTATFTALAASGSVHFQLEQDGTGGRAFVINDGFGHSSTVPIPTDPGSPFEVIVESPDGTTLFITVLGGPTSPTYAVLSADMGSIASQTTLQPISGLAMPIGSSLTEIWRFDWVLLATAANATMDLKTGLTLPSGATAVWGVDGGGTGVAGWNATQPAASALAILAGGGTDALGTGVAAMLGYKFTGLVFGGGTAGNVVLTYAQNTSDAGTLVVNKGSMVTAVRVHA